MRSADTTPTKKAKNNDGKASPSTLTPPSSAMKSMKISSPIVISSDDDPTPRKRNWDEWGAGADLVYVPSDDEEPAPASQAISVTSGSESAVSVTSGSDDDLWDSWGADAVMHFNADSESDGYDAFEFPSSPPREPSPTPSRAPPAPTAPAPKPPGPTMPDYNSWEIPKLKVSCCVRREADCQKLVEGYGFRASKDKGGLVRIATECWVAIHGTVSESEEEVPLAQLHTPKAKTPKGARPRSAKVATEPETPSKSKGKGKAKEDMTPEQLDELFFAMIRDDDEFYLRILRYEPIHWDEFLSRAIRDGAYGKGWKDRLRAFLDRQGITFYTADPGQPRSRQKKRR